MYHLENKRKGKEMWFLRTMAGYWTLNHKHGVNERDELKIVHINTIIQKGRNKIVSGTLRKNEKFYIPKIFHKYIPTRKKDQTYKRTYVHARLNTLIVWHTFQKFPTCQDQYVIIHKHISEKCRLYLLYTVHRQCAYAHTVQSCEPMSSILQQLWLFSMDSAQDWCLLQININYLQLS